MVLSTERELVRRHWYPDRRSPLVTALPEQFHEIAGAPQAPLVELATMERAIGRIPLTRKVLERASMPMATLVRTLDAIHLASALLLQDRLGTKIFFATHDIQQ